MSRDPSLDAGQLCAVEPCSAGVRLSATYRLGPYEPPVERLDAIAAMWEREREGPDEPFAMRSAIVALDGDTAVVRLEVHYTGSRPQEYRDLWIVELDGAGRCRSFEECPFWPERTRVDPDPVGRDEHLSY